MISIVLGSGGYGVIRTSLRQGGGGRGFLIEGSLAIASNELSERCLVD